LKSKKIYDKKDRHTKDKLKVRKNKHEVREKGMRE
jgi:hypothetical protein